MDQLQYGQEHIHTVRSPLCHFSVPFERLCFFLVLTVRFRRCYNEYEDCVTEVNRTTF